MNKLPFLLLLVTLPCFSQTNYYVATTGSNTNAGTLVAPFQTIQYALNNMPGSSILNVAGGIYHEKIQVPTSNVTLRNQTSAAAIIDATGIGGQNAIIAISNKNNITIDGLELRNNIQNDAQGILVEGFCTGITIRNCYVHDIHFSSNPNAAVSAATNAQGIIVYGTNATNAISNLTITNNQLANCRLGYSEGIAINGNVDGFEVSHNSVHDLTNIGIDLIGHEGTCPTPSNDQARNGVVKDNVIHHCLSAYATSGGLYIDGGKNIVVERNKSYHNGYGIEVGCENVGKTTPGITVRDNIFYDNQVCGIALGGFDYPNGSGKVTGAVVRNNTCFSNDYANSGNGELYLSYSENTILENNIFYTNAQNNLAYAELSQPGLTFNYNAIYCPGGNANLYASWNGSDFTGYTAFVAGTASNANSVFGNPNFAAANVTTPDFHLLANSPAINAGKPSFTAAANETDFFGELRVENTVVDCGADEFGTTLAVDLMPEKEFSFYPNPVRDWLYVQGFDENVSLVLFNLDGQKIKSAEGTKLDVRDLPKGMYVLRIVEGEKAFSRKVMKL